MYFRSSLIASFFLLACTALADHYPEPPPGRSHIAPEHKYKPNSPPNEHFARDAHPYGVPNVGTDHHDGPDKRPFANGKGPEHAHGGDVRVGQHVARDAKDDENDGKPYARVGKPQSVAGKDYFGDGKNGLDGLEGVAVNGVKDSAKQFKEGPGKDAGHWARSAKEFEGGHKGGRKGFEGLKGGAKGVVGKGHGGAVGARDAKNNKGFVKGKDGKGYEKGRWGM